jgi:hypothetical protein
MALQTIADFLYDHIDFYNESTVPDLRKCLNDKMEPPRHYFDIGFGDIGFHF